MMTQERFEELSAAYHLNALSDNESEELLNYLNAQATDDERKLFSDDYKIQIALSVIHEERNPNSNHFEKIKKKLNQKDHQRSFLTIEFFKNVAILLLFLSTVSLSWVLFNADTLNQFSSYNSAEDIVQIALCAGVKEKLMMPTDNKPFYGKSYFNLKQNRIVLHICSIPELADKSKHYIVWLLNEENEKKNIFAIKDTIINESNYIIDPKDHIINGHEKLFISIESDRDSKVPSSDVVLAINSI